MVREDPDVVVIDSSIDDSRPLKKKRSNVISSEATRDRTKKTLDGFRSGNGMIDDDYRWFLTHIVNEPIQSMTEEINVDEDDEDEDENDMDPQYILFLKKLTKDGKSYVLEVPEKGSVSVLLKYEAQDEYDRQLNGSFQRRQSIVSKEDNIEKEKAIESVKTKDSVENLRNFGHSERDKRRVSVTEGCSRETSFLENGDQSKPREKCAVENSMVDSCYQSFLHGIENAGQHLTFVCGDGRRVLYEEDDEMSSDSEVLIWDDNPYCSEEKNNPFITSKANRSNNNACGTSKFRTGVMSILSQPYDQKEYESLLKEIKEEKLLGRLIDLRGRPVSSSLGVKKSYLDHHRDLKKKLDAVRHDRPKALNILRGFFYWLKHLANEGDGVFKPWLDALCLAVLPGS